MSTIKDGGAAFPVVGMAQLGTQEIHAIFQSGMTLRDYFAAKAMQGILAGPASREGVPIKEWMDAPVHAYKLADAMLAAREAQS